MYRKQKKIPTIIGVLLIVLAIAGISILDSNRKNIQLVAKESTYPKQIQFSNVSDGSFVISWLTDEQTEGFVILSDGQKNYTFFDDLDSDNIIRPRITHYVSAKNLREETTYKVKIISGQKDCTLRRLCPVYSQKTAKRLTDWINLPPLSGTIYKMNNKAAVGAVVYVIVAKSAPLSARVDSNGLFVVPLTNLRANVFASRPKIADNDIIQINAKLSDKEETTAVFDIKSLRLNNPVPSMYMGNSYNFINLISKKNKNDTSAILGVDNQATVVQSITPTVKKNEVELFFPKNDNDTTIDRKPRFRGTGPFNTQITITINSKAITAKVIIGRDGTWNFRPKQELSPGVHQITISWKNEQGNPVNLVRKFIVFKSGEQVLGESTPSATFTPTPITLISPTATIIPSPTFTPTPTDTPTPTETPEAFVTIIPPPTASTTPLVTILFFGTIFLLAGIKLFFFP